jgi:hypothetical protein
MTKKTSINEYIFTLFIEKGLDGLTVPALRDELLTITGEFNDITEARKFLYRQLLPLEKKGLLWTKGQGRPILENYSVNLVTLKLNTRYQVQHRQLQCINQYIGLMVVGECCIEMLLMCCMRVLRVAICAGTTKRTYSH